MSCTTPSIQLASDISTEDDIFSKIIWRLVPFLFFCYLAAYLDRVNVRFAKFQMQKELAFSETVYGLGAGIFFLGYVLFEVPSNIILHKVGARLWLARVMLTMGGHLGRNRVRQYADSILRRALLARCRRGWLHPWGVAVSHLSIPSIVFGVAILFYLDNSLKDAKWLDAMRSREWLRSWLRNRRKRGLSELPHAFVTGRVWFLGAGLFLHRERHLYRQLLDPNHHQAKRA